MKSLSSPSPNFLRRHAVLVSLVALTALLELAIYVRSPVIAPDGIHFIAIAQELSRDPLAALRDNDQHPGFPALIVAARETIFAAWRSDEAWSAAARLVSAAFGVGGVIVVWLLSRRLANATVANIAALLYVVLPVLRQNAVDALSDTPHLVLYLASALLVSYAARRRSLWQFAAAGAVSGLAFLVRPEGLSVALVAPLAVIATGAWRRHLGPGRSAAACCAIGAGAALLVVPYAAASGKITSKITSKIGWQTQIAPPSLRPLAAPSVAAVAVAPPPTVSLTPIPYVAPIAQRSWASALLQAVPVFGERVGECLRWILLAPLAVGLWAIRRVGDRALVQFLTALALFHIGLLLLLYCLGGYIDRRHVMPLVGLLLPTIAAGLVALHQFATRWAVTRRQPRLAAGIGLALVLLLVAPRSLRPLNETHGHTTTAARVLDQRAAPGDTVLSNSGHVLYYTALRGKIAGGVLLQYGRPTAGPTQPGGHRFAVLERGGEQFQSAWSGEIEALYAPIASIPADPARDQNEIVIYERRAAVAHCAGDDWRR